MTDDEIIEMAREAGFAWDRMSILCGPMRHLVATVAARAAAEEREACAVIGDENAKSLVSIVGLPVATSTAIQHDRAKQWGMYAAAIRARGQEARARISNHNPRSMT